MPEPYIPDLYQRSALPVTIAGAGGETSQRASDLVEAARSAAKRAWAPYSHFRVGAAVLGEHGEIVLGCNVESASYGLSCCAERVSLFSAVAQGTKPTRLAVACVDAPPESPVSSRTPCGACRQVILDLMGAHGLVEIDGVGQFTAHELLPHGFVLPA